MKERTPQVRRRIDVLLIVSAAFLLIAFALFALGTDYARELFEKAEATSTFAIKGEGLTRAEVDQVMALNEQREEGYSLVFWVQAHDVEVENETLSRIEELSVIYTSGNTGLLFPETNIDALADNVCLMSKGATVTLAASPGEDGLDLTAADSTYHAMDTLPFDKTFLVLKAASDSEVLFDRLTIQANDDGSFPLTENTVEQSLNIGVVPLDYQVFSFLSFALLAAVPLILAVFLIVMSTHCVGNEKGSLVSRILTLFCISSCLVVVTFIIIGLLTEFSAYFPTRWSVFSEWKSVAANFAERTQTLFTSKIAVPDEAYYALFATVFVMAVSALVSLMISYHFYSVSTIRARAGYVDRFTLQTNSSSEPFVDKTKGIMAERLPLASTKHPVKYPPHL